MAGWIVLSALLAMTLVTVATRNGPAVNGDTWDYLWHALGTQPDFPHRTNPYGITHFPPGYPAALAAGNVLAGRAMEIEPLLDTARQLNILLVGVNVALAAWLGFRLISRGRPAGENASLAHYRAAHAASLAAVLFATLSEPGKFHTVAISEGLFLSMTLASLALLTGRQTLAMLAAAGLMAGFSYLVRYAGVALICSGGLWVLLTSGPTLRQRLIRLAVFALPIAACVGLALWRNHHLGGNVGGRPLEFHPAGYAEIRDVLKTLTRWLLPSEIMIVPLIVCVVVAIAVMFRFGPMLAGVVVDETLGRPQGPAAGAVLLYCLTYAGLLVVTRLLFDPVLQIGMRMLLPLQILIIISLAAWCVFGRRWIVVRQVTLIALLLIPILNVCDIIAWVMQPNG